MSTLAGELGGALSPTAEALLRALYDLAADNPAEIRALALEVVQSMSVKEIAIIIMWRDGCRGMEPDYGSLLVTFAGDLVTSDFGRKSRSELVRPGKKRK